MRQVLRSKIHKATVTDGNINYIGSITVDSDLLDRAGIWPNEQVQVVSNTTGANFITYVIPAPAGSGEICMNGAAALYCQQGEEIIIMAYELTDKPIQPQLLLVDADNRFLRYLEAGETELHG
ncbi:MAG: aspartate 1-decarboxylase [Gammaproteobacteria bacterium]